MGCVLLTFVVSLFVGHRPVSCVPNVAIVSGLSVLASSVFSNVYIVERAAIFSKW